METEGIFQAVRDGGAVVALLFFIFGGVRGIWMFTSHHREVVTEKDRQIADIKQDRDFWRDAAIKGLDAAELGVHMAARQTKA